MLSPTRAETVRLQNSVLETSVFPGIGAKIWDLVHLPSGRQLLWHNPRIPPTPYPIDANFDNYWAGGWDDAFPTCEACTYKGEQYPNLGELRSVAWQVESFHAGGDEPEVTLSAYGPINPVRASKTIRLNGGSLTMDYRIENIGTLPIDFIWGTHPAYRIEAGWKIHVPASTGIVGISSHAKLGSQHQHYAWPNLTTAEGTVDMSETQSFESGLSAGHYVTGLSAGWYALEDPTTETGLLVEFPRETCPYLWLWLSYGGWRGYQLAVIEPWTSYPVTLSEAVSEETHRTLQPHEAFTCRITLTPWSKPTMLDQLLSTKKLGRLAVTR